MKKIFRFTSTAILFLLGGTLATVYRQNIEVASTEFGVDGILSRILSAAEGSPLFLPVVALFFMALGATIALWLLELFSRPSPIAHDSWVELNNINSDTSKWKNIDEVTKLHEKENVCIFAIKLNRAIEKPVAVVGTETYNKDKWRELYYRDGLFVIEFLFHDDNQTHEATLQLISESELSKINPNERRQKLQVYEYTKYNRNLGL